MKNLFLQIFNEELYALHHLSKNFTHTTTNDNPNTKSLLESVAFLTARIKLQLEDDYSLISQSLLDIFLPHSIRPIPACSIIRFIPDTSSTNVCTIPTGTELSITSESDNFIFSTTYPITIYPWSITSVKFDSTGKAHSTCLTIELECLNQHCSIAHFKPDEIILHITTTSNYCHEIYEMLLNQVSFIVLSSIDNPETHLKQTSDCITAVGFSENESLFPYPENSFIGYRLLTEYFTFPEKFMFIKICINDKEFLSKLKQNIKIQIYCKKDNTISNKYINESTFALHCVPVINMIKLPAKPIIISNRNNNYQLTVDTNDNQKNYTICSIDKLFATSNQGELLHIMPYFCHRRSTDNNLVYWHTHRRNQRLHLALIDPTHKLLNDEWTIGSDVLASNTHLPDLRNNNSLQFWKKNFSSICDIQWAARISSLLDPTSLEYNHWQLIAHLSCNYLGLQNSDLHASKLRSLLNLYNPHTSEYTKRCIESILDITIKPSNLLCATNSYHHFIRCLQIELTINESEFKNSSWYLLMHILSEFYRVYSSINTLTQLTILNQAKKILAKFKPMSGTECVI